MKKIDYEKTREAVLIVGKGTTDEKLEGWRVIGETVIMLREKHGIDGKGGGDKTNTAYADDIKLCNLDVMAAQTARNAAVFAENQKIFSAARAALKSHLATLAPGTSDAKAITKALGWSSVSMVNKVIKGYQENGLEGALERIRKETDRTKKGAHEKETAKPKKLPAGVKTLSDGREDSSRFDEFGVEFRNMIHRLNKLTPEEREKLIASFTGAKNTVGKHIKRDGDTITVWSEPRVKTGEAIITFKLIVTKETKV